MFRAAPHAVPFTLMMVQLSISPVSQSGLCGEKWGQSDRQCLLAVLVCCSVMRMWAPRAPQHLC